jgi:hypothetical protein
MPRDWDILIQWPQQTYFTEINVTNIDTATANHIPSGQDMVPDLDQHWKYMKNFIAKCYKWLHPTFWVFNARIQVQVQSYHCTTFQSDPWFFCMRLEQHWFLGISIKFQPFLSFFSKVKMDTILICRGPLISSIFCSTLHLVYSFALTFT